MRLTTISDLGQDRATKGVLIERAMQLGRWYGDFKATDTEAHSYQVDIGGERKRAPGIHASEISNCQRVMVYSLRDVERKSVDAAVGDTNMRQRFGMGHAIHAMLQDDFKRMCERFNGALTFRDEVKIDPSLGSVAEYWGMHSSCDGEFTFWYDSKPYIRIGVEIKSMSAPEFDKLLRPKPEHLEQTCLYQAALDLPLMWLIYYNKSNSNWTNSEPPYLFQFDEHLWSTHLQPRFHEAHTNAKTNALPPREEGQYCRWCPFAWTCQPPSLVSRQQRGPQTVARRPGALRVLK
jgi:hypothetical protein